MGRNEVRRTRRHVDVFAIAEPELMHAARMFARAIEEADRLRVLRLGDVEQLHARRLHVLLLGLVGDRHDVAAGLQRVGAHVALRQVGLADHLGLARIGDVDGGEVLWRAFVRQPDDAPAVGRDLHRHALAHAAEAVEHVVGQELEVPGDDSVGAGARGVAADGGLVNGGGFRGLDNLLDNLLGNLLGRRLLGCSLLLGTFHNHLPTGGQDREGERVARFFG